MSTEPAPTDLAVACHVRPALVLEPIDAKIETLRACERDGRIDSLLLRSWPGEVAIADDCPYPEVLERLDEFERWADRAGVSIFPPFQTRETTSVASNRTVERLVTPTICLACYDDGELVGVFPHTDGDTTYTVPEAISALRTGTLPEPLRERPAEPRARAEVGGSSEAADLRRSATAESDGDACPDCGRTLTNVQGILDCPSCRRIVDTTAPLAKRN